MEVKFRCDKCLAELESWNDTELESGDLMVWRAKPCKRCMETAVLNMTLKEVKEILSTQIKEA